MSETIGLLMIVRDEENVILRAINSVLPLIDEYLILDAKSTDQTQSVIERAMRENEIPGQVISKEWVNFGVNRSYLMKKAFKIMKCDFFALIDADEILVKSDFGPLDQKDKTDFLEFARLHPEISLFPILTHYKMENYDPVEYPRHQLIRNNQLYEWIMPYHEKLIPTSSNAMIFYPNIINHTRREGYCSRNPNKSNRYIKEYRLWLETHPNHSRTIYYLGQTYRDIGKYNKSIQWYEKRLELEGDIQEIYVTLISLGRLYSHLKDYHTARDRLLTAIKKFPHRLEPFYELMVLLSDKFQDYQAAFDISKGAPTKRPDPLDALVEPMVYKWKFQYKRAALTWYIGKKDFGRTLILELLAYNRVPSEHIFFVQTQLSTHFSL